ncbi:MAG TPA: cytochrome c [Gemmatimonadales bacterium]|nr:cytochrome c [Gemmatimonadales bacterium]
MTLSLLRPLARLLPLSATLLVAASWGGWAVITLDDVPDAVAVGKPVTLTFTVRQHGHTLLDNLRPSVDARARDSLIRAEAVPAGGRGRYTATFTLPDTGQWRLTVNSGWGTSHVDLEPIAVIGAAQAPPVYATGERGRRLFVAKGCVTCHVHGDVAGSGVVQVGPELTALRLPSDFLAKFLADPTILPPAQQSNGGMPTLELKPAEIAALVSFINGEGAAARAGSGR